MAGQIVSQICIYKYDVGSALAYPEHEDTTGPETVSSELQKDDEFMESSPLTKVELL